MRLQQPSVLVSGVGTAYLNLVLTRTLGDIYSNLGQLAHICLSSSFPKRSVCYPPRLEKFVKFASRPRGAHAGSPRRRRRGRDASAAPRAGAAGRRKPSSSPSARARHAHRIRGFPRRLAALARPHDSRARRSRLRLQSARATARATDRPAAGSRAGDRRLARDGSDYMASCAGALSVAQGPPHALSWRSRARLAPLTH